MFYDFSHRHTPCLVDSQAEAVVISRESKDKSIIGKEFLYNGLFSPISLVARGSMIVATDRFLVQSLRDTVDGDKYCSLIKTNVQINVMRFSQSFDSNDNPIGAPTFTFVATGVHGFANFVSARLRQEDPGLLPSTTYTLMLQKSADIKNPQDDALQAPDRIVMDGRPFQVDSIDHLRYPGLQYVQLSEDTR